MTSPPTDPIFPSWHSSQWKAVDDRVRGGASQSHLDEVDVSSVESEKKVKAAKFWGHLDIDTLGGAGFASQRYRFGPRPLALPRFEYKGIRLTVVPDEDKDAKQTSEEANTFTLVIKTSLTERSPKKPKPPSQPEQASLSYETSFTPSKSTSLDKAEEFKFHFKDFKATYRGREIGPDHPLYKPLATDTIYELSLMCRSDFGTQKGDFSVVIGEITSWEKSKTERAEDARGVLSSAWTSVVAFFTGVFTWIWSFGGARGRGRIALSDEEKEPLV